MVKYFRASHKEFYEEFEIWRKSMLKNSLPQSGVYEFIANREIGRVLKLDPIGILYIGKGLILPYHNRIGKFVNSINSTEEIHKGGIRYIKDIEEKYPIKKSKIRITLSNSPEKLEHDLLMKYLSKFGELPPLNRLLS